MGRLSTDNVKTNRICLRKTNTSEEFFINTKKGVLIMITCPLHTDLKLMLLMAILSNLVWKQLSADSAVV